MKSGIIMVAETFQPAYVQEIANAMAREGHPVLLVGSTAHEGGDYEPGVTLVNLRGDAAPRRSAFEKARDWVLYCARTFALLSRRNERAVYHVGILKPFLEGVLLNAALRVAGKTVVHTVHNVLPHDAPGWRNRALYTVIYRWTSDYLVAHTEETRRRLLALGVSSDRIVVAGHGTYSVPDGARIDRAEARGRLGIGERDFALLLFGHQRPYKGTHFLLDAMGRRRYDGARIVIRGVAHDGYDRRVFDTISRWGLASTVDCRFGEVDDREMALLFSAADAAVLPYFEGSQSGVMFMAFAFGIPVISSDLPGLRDAVVAGANGEVFAAGDEESLMAAVEKVRLARGSYDGRLIRRLARDRHSWGACASALSANIFARIDAGEPALAP